MISVASAAFIVEVACGISRIQVVVFVYEAGDVGCDQVAINVAGEVARTDVHKLWPIRIAHEYSIVGSEKIVRCGRVESPEL